MRATEVRLSSRADDVLRGLESAPDKRSQSIARRVKSLALRLRDDALHGEMVRAAHIPVSLRERHAAENLYVEDLPSYRRLLYSIVRRADGLHVNILEIVDHGTYDTWFPGRGR